LDFGSPSAAWSEYRRLRGCALTGRFGDVSQIHHDMMTCLTTTMLNISFASIYSIIKLIQPPLQANRTVTLSSEDFQVNLAPQPFLHP